MKPRVAKQILNCSYTTLHNYVKAGKIKLSGLAGKQHDYDDDSVNALYDELYSGNASFNNCVHIFINSRKYEFNLNEAIAKKIMETISNELQKELRK